MEFVSLEGTGSAMAHSYPAARASIVAMPLLSGKSLSEDCYKPLILNSLLFFTRLLIKGA
jgi:hypothetical protein